MKKYFLFGSLLMIFLIVTAKKATGQVAQQAQKTDTVPHLQSTRLHEVSIAARNKKLPNIQKVSVRAPDDLKIDGSLEEWDNRFKAFNKTTGLFYTISNNDEYIYLTVQAKNKRIINKLMSGGMSFTISNSCIATDTTNVTILFPLMPLPLSREILHTAGKGITETPNGRYEVTYKSNKVSIPQANNELIENMQYIKVAGVEKITDFVNPFTVTNYQQFPLLRHNFKLLSIDNQSGIKAITRFDDKGAYNYELAIPVRYLNRVIDNYQKFGYNITLHGRSEDNRPGAILCCGPYLTSKVAYNADVETPTGFWGEYVIVGQ